MTTKYMLVRPDGNVLPINVSTLEDLQISVGGLITVVPVMNGMIPDDSTVFANDEGILIGLERNPLAEELTGYPMIVGNVLIGGAVDDEGETMSISEETTAIIMNASKHEVEEVAYA